LIKKLIISAVLCFITSITAIQAQTIHLKYIATDKDKLSLSQMGVDSSTHKNLQSLFNERNKTLDLLHKSGYLQAQHDALEKKNDSTYISYIYIGNKTNTVIIQTNPPNWPKLLKTNAARPKTNQLVVPMDKLETQLSDIQTKWENQGYSFVKVQLEDLAMRKDTLFANLAIVKNELRKIDSIKIKGYNDFPIKILRHRFGLKPNRQLSNESIKNASQTMEATGIARETRSPEVLYEKDKSTVFLYFEKMNNNYFDGIIGFATQEATGKLEFSGNLNLNLHNNLNKGERLILNYLADAGDQEEINIELETPYIANTPLSANGGINIFKKDSTYTTTNLNAKIKFDIKNWSHYIGYEKVESVNRLEHSLSNDGIISLHGNHFFFGSSYTQYQNDLLQPILTYSDVKITTGRRNTDLQSENQVKIEVEALHNIVLGGNNSLYTKINLGKLWSNTYYINESFKVGGVKNIRGFNENSIDASQLTLLQTEYRYRATKDMYIHTITDIGWIENKVQNTSDTLIGLGIGIGFYNKIGLMNIQFANGFTNRESIDFDKTRIHISLHTRF